MAEQGPGPEQEAERTVTDRWWIDRDRDRQKSGPRPTAPVGSRFYRAAAGYDQDTAHAQLTEINLRILQVAAAEEGRWGHLAFFDQRFPRAERERIQTRIALPAYARGVVVDSGRTIRILVTGTPIGERILELFLGEPPAFDCWVLGEWIEEEEYASVEEALSAFRRHIEAYLSPAGIQRWRERTMQG